jgi:hypothetical protein
LFHAAEEHAGQRVGSPPCLRASHSWLHRTQLKSFLGFFGCANNTVSGGNFNFGRVGFGVVFFVFFGVLMVVV